MVKRLIVLAVAGERVLEWMERDGGSHSGPSNVMSDSINVYLLCLIAH